MQRFAAYFSLGVALLNGSTSFAQMPTQATATTTVARRAAPATVTLFIINRTGDTISQGSGFLLRPEGVIVTSWHVLLGSFRAVVRLHSGEEYERVTFVDGDPVADIAILRVPGHALPYLRPSDLQPEPGAPVVVVGSPLGLAQTVSTGVIAATRVHDGKEVIQITAPVSPGSSGGPVLDLTGMVIGVVRSSIRDAQQLNFAVPIKYALGLLTTQREERSLASVFSNLPTSGLQRALLPSRASIPRISLLGSYRLSVDISVKRDDRLDQFSDTGLLVLGDNLGWMTVITGASPQLVTSVRTEGDGRVLLTAAGLDWHGYQTDRGLYIQVLEEPTHISANAVREASNASLGIAGIYDVRVNTSYNVGDRASPDHVLWTGLALLATNRDSVYVVLSLANAAGGKSGMIQATRLLGTEFYFNSADGSSLWGSVRDGRIDAQWKDRRSGGGYFSGILVGRRR